MYHVTYYAYIDLIYIFSVGRSLHNKGCTTVTWMSSTANLNLKLVMNEQSHLVHTATRGNVCTVVISMSTEKPYFKMVLCLLVWQHQAQ